MGKLRDRARKSKYGWSESELRRLYEESGFVAREGAKHPVYSHPEYPQLRATGRRARELPPGYIETALELLDELDRLKALKEGQQ
jgi:hypothetical protein